MEIILEFSISSTRRCKTTIYIKSRAFTPLSVYYSSVDIFITYYKHHLVYTPVTEHDLLHEKTYKLISSLARVKRARNQLHESKELFGLACELSHRVL
jgi:hypothetical protein